MADPECVGLDSISHLVADHCSRSTPTVVLASAMALHLFLGSLCLPVVDLSTREVDLMTAKVRPGGDRAVVSLTVIQVDDGLLRPLVDLQSTLVSGICSCLRMGKKLFSIQKRIDDGSIDAILHAEHGGSRTVSAQTWAAVLRRSGRDHDKHHLSLACGTGLGDDHADQVVGDSAISFDHPYLPRCLRRDDLGGGRVPFSEREERCEEGGIPPEDLCHIRRHLTEHDRHLPGAFSPAYQR